MKRLIFLLIVLLAAGRTFGQPWIYGNAKQYVCVGHSWYFQTSLPASADCTWQISTDNGQSWATITASPTYPNPNQGSLLISTIDLSMNNALFRFFLTSDPLYISQPDTLVVFSQPANKPVFINPPTDVCQGQTVPIGVTGNLTMDSISWTATGATVQRFTFIYNVNDTVEGINFPNTGTATIEVFAENGCYTLHSNSTTTITVTVHPLQTSLAGVAGGGPVCNTGSVYPGVATTYSDGSCDPVAAITPAGASPVSGDVQSCVTVDASVQSFNGAPYVPRHYSLEPANNAATSTATVTLYFTQADFDAYNAARSVYPALPTGPADATGISNLHIAQFHGTGTTPGTYAGGSGDIDPDDSKIVWNATASRWEVTFDITGFSGFFASGSPIVALPLTLTEFSGKAVPGGNQLSWTTASEENTAYFELQRQSSSGGVFAGVAKIPAAGNSSQPLQYSYTDEWNGAAPEIRTYRIRMADLDGKFTYSKVVTLQPAVTGVAVRVTPNPFVQPSSLVVSLPAAGNAVLTVTDMSGKKLIEKTLTLQKGESSLDTGILGRLAPGIYLMKVATGTQQMTLKFVKE